MTSAHAIITWNILIVLIWIYSYKFVEYDPASYLSVVLVHLLDHPLFKSPEWTKDKYKIIDLEDQDSKLVSGMWLLSVP